MDPNVLTVAFSKSQLALLFTVSFAGLLILGRWGLTLFQKSLDSRFESVHEVLANLSKRMDEIPKNHPTREEMSLTVQVVESKVKAVDRRLTDLGIFVHGRRFGNQVEDSQG